MSTGEKIREEIVGDTPQLSLDELLRIQSDYPYFQTVRFLYLKRLQKERPHLYRQALENNAIYSGDRKSLFFLLEGARQSWTSLYRNMAENDNKESNSFSLIDSFLAAHTEESPEMTERLLLQTGATAIDYLSLSKTEIISGTDGKSNFEHGDLIDSFIEKSEKGEALIPSEKFPEPDFTAKPTEKLLTESTDEAFLTESLAKIYIKQRRYSKALEIIKKLSLKYPEKNIYFADQIRFLEKLIDNIKNE